MQAILTLVADQQRQKRTRKKHAKKTARRTGKRKTDRVVLDLGYLNYVSTAYPKYKDTGNIIYLDEDDYLDSSQQHDPSSAKFYLHKVPKKAIQRTKLEVTPMSIDSVTSTIGLHIAAASELTGLKKEYILSNLMESQTHLLDRHKYLLDYLESKVNYFMDDIDDMLDELASDDSDNDEEYEIEIDWEE